MPENQYADNVFINCPFDEEYMQLLYAMVYTVYRCGFIPKSALGQDNGLQMRLDKITLLIEQCRFGIHDISRVELSENKLPRFNMPFELGIFYGAQRFGNNAQNTKNALVLDSVPYRYQQFISDLNGIDIKIHQNDELLLIQKIRNWLYTASGKTVIPGHKIIAAGYLDLKSKLPLLLKKSGLYSSHLTFNDYCAIVEEILEYTPG
jgi:hypothetical protein